MNPSYTVENLGEDLVLLASPEHRFGTDAFLLAVTLLVLTVVLILRATHRADRKRKALLAAVPSIETGKNTKRIILEGDVPSPIDPPPGCRFCKRCWMADERCAREEPEMLDLGTGSHRVACHRVAEQLQGK